MKIVLIIGMVFPEPQSTGAGSRMLELIQLFQKDNYRIVFASAAADSEYMFDLNSINVEKVSIRLNDSNFDTFVKKLNPQIVLFDRFVTEEQFGWRITENCPNALRILDTEDLHCLRLARQKAYEEDRYFDTNDLFSETAKREIASILRCDVSLIISEFEIDLLKKVFKIDASILYYLPFVLKPITIDEQKKWPKFNERTNFIFVGNFLHEPNCNAVQYLKKSIWPKLKQKLPEAKMLLYGAYPSKKITDLHQPKDNFFVMGRAENSIEEVQKARVVLAPLQTGAGIKKKLIEAMQCGTPNVTTPIGAEGINDNLPWSGTIANSAEEIINASISIYTNENEWDSAQNQGVKIINNRFNFNLFESNFLSMILELQENIQTIRKTNFLGEILKHHTLSSTLYLSKWIEEKNKR
jgi:O-antigen biosynthesis protein